MPVRLENPITPEGMPAPDPKRGHQPDGSRTRQLPLLLRLGQERPEPITGCPAASCDPTELTPIDVYCTDHGRLIPFATETPSRTRLLIVNLIRAVACGSFLLAALLDSLLPLYLVYLAAGAAIAAVQLHRYQMSRRLVVAAAVVVGVGTLVTAYAGATVDAVLRTVLFIAVLVAWAFYGSEFAWFRGHCEPGGRIERAAGAVGAGLAVASAALLALAVVNLPARLLVEVPVWTSTVLALAAVGAVTGAVLLAAIVGAIDGQAHVDSRVDPLLSRPRPLRLVTWSVPATRRSGRASLEKTLAEFGSRSMAIVVAAAGAVTNVVLRAARLAAIAGVNLVNWLHRRAVMAFRRTRAALVSTGLVLVAATRLGFISIAAATRNIMVPAACLTAGCWLVLIAAEENRHYLVTGSLAGLAVLAVSLALAAAVFAAVAVSLAGLRLSKAARAVGHSASVAAPHGLVLLAIGGWVVGLPGTLGHGPVSVGWVTITATILLVGAVLFSRLRHEHGPATT